MRASRIICRYCKKVILDGHGSTSHGICPKCLKRELQKSKEEEWEKKERKESARVASNSDG